MADIEFVQGLIIKAPSEKAPDFVKASISIKVEELGIWLREKHKAGQEWVNIDVKESKGGKWYAAVSTFKPKTQAEVILVRASDLPPPKKRTTLSAADMEDDIPF